MKQVGRNRWEFILIIFALIGSLFLLLCPPWIEAYPSGYAVYKGHHFLWTPPKCEDWPDATLARVDLMRLGLLLASVWVLLGVVLYSSRFFAASPANSTSKGEVPWKPNPFAEKSEAEIRAIAQALDKPAVQVCHLIAEAKSKRLTPEIMRQELIDVETIFESEHFDVYTKKCKKCGAVYLMCFREYTTGDGDDDCWDFWIPVTEADIRDIKATTPLMKAVGELAASRSLICWHPDGHIVWMEHGFHLALIVFLPF